MGQPEPVQISLPICKSHEKPLIGLEWAVGVGDQLKFPLFTSEWAIKGEGLSA